MGLKMIVVVHAFPRLARRGLHDRARFAGFRAAHGVKLAPMPPWRTPPAAAHALVPVPSIARRIPQIQYAIIQLMKRSADSGCRHSSGGGMTEPGKGKPRWPRVERAELVHS